MPTCSSCGCYENITITVQTGLSFQANDFVQLYDGTNSYIWGEIVSYNSGTGELILTPCQFCGDNGALSGWTVSLSGIPGISGTSGLSGTSGSSGTSGESGSSGSSGESGSSGSSGESGSSGTSGESGSSGTSGESGSSGSSGADGADGSSGSSGGDGSSGSSGADGADGSSGSSGADGADGSSGSSGASGSSGTSGANGANGSSGTSGASGASGSSGTSGANGASGASGSSGTSGASGTSGVSPTGQIILTAGGSVPGSASPASNPSVANATTNSITYTYVSFANGTQSYVEWSIAMPSDYNGGTITAQFYWLANSASTNSVVWGLQGICYPDNLAIDTAYGTAQTVTDANGGTNVVNNSPTTSAITLAGTPAASQFTQIRVYRLGSGADTLAVAANLLAVRITYTRA